MSVDRTPNLVMVPIEKWIDVSKGRQLYYIGSCAVVSYITWKCIKFLSRCGNSENGIFRGCHKFLRKFMNAGLMMKMTDFSFPTDISICSYGYGIYPRQVLEYRMAIHEEIEACPDQWFRFTAWPRWQAALQIIGKAMGANSKDLVFLKNVTEGIHCVLTWMPLQDEDAVLISDQANNAVKNAAFYHCQKKNAKVITAVMQFPIAKEDDILNLYIDLLTKHKNIKLVILDHITCQSAVLMPLKRLIDLCHQFNKLVVVDGAHAPGQIELQLDNLGADFYVGNLYKWYYAPRPSGFLWVKPEFQSTFDPTLVSHYYQRGFHERFYQQGVSDYSNIMAAAYAVGTYYPSIGGLEHLYWYNTSLLHWAVKMMTSSWGTEKLHVPQSMQPPFLAVIKLPSLFQRFYSADATGVKKLAEELFDEFRVILMPVVVQNELMIRITTQICSTKHEYYNAARAIQKKAAELVELKNLAI